MFYFQILVFKQISLFKANNKFFLKYKMYLKETTHTINDDSTKYLTLPKTFNLSPKS